MAQDLEANKRNAIGFYGMAFSGQAKAAVLKYVGEEYIQHNPLVGDGKHAFIEYFDDMQMTYPEKSIDFIRAVAENDMVCPAYQTNLAGK